MNEKKTFKPYIKRYGKNYMSVAEKRKAHTKNNYIKKLKKDNPKVRCIVLKKKTKKGYRYGIYARSKK